MIKRVELLFPILDVGIKKRILDVLDLHMKDTMKAREQNGQGQYKSMKTKKNECAFNSQEELLKLTYRVNHGGE
jgi:polyphosphate kinase